MAQILFDYLPILLFFITFKLYGIYAATAVAIVASFCQVASYYLMHKRFEKTHIIMLVLITLLGGATIVLHNEIYIKWKPTAVYWALALILLGSHWIGKKVAIQHLLESKLELPRPIWKRLNLAWVMFFIFLGIANIYVVYHFSTNTWVYFKLFGTFGLILLFVVLQSFYLAKHCDDTIDSSIEVEDKRS